MTDPSHYLTASIIIDIYWQKCLKDKAYNNIIANLLPKIFIGYGHFNANNRLPASNQTTLVIDMCVNILSGMSISPVLNLKDLTVMTKTC